MFVCAGDLNVRYEDRGPRGAPTVVLLHGWPDDASTWDAVAPHLNAAGLRTIAPTWRGFGETSFLEPTALRTGDSGILAMDVIALCDALGIDEVCVAGHDWGSNAAEAMAVGWPARVRRLAMLSTPPRLGGMPTPAFGQAHRQWYHWFQATRRGAEAVAADPRGFAQIMWRNWSPPGWFDPVTFRRVAHAFDNPDWVAVTLHSYRSRWGEAEPDARSAWLEDRVKTAKSLALPALYIQGEVDGVNPPETSENTAAKFSGPFQRVILPGVGHFPSREQPNAVAKLLCAHFT